MPELITRLLLLILLVTLIWYLVRKLIPKDYLTVLGGMAVVILLVLIFQNPVDPFAGSLWGLLSLPFKPLGLSVLLLGLALFKGEEKMKDLDVNLVLWAFAILLIFSTPLVAYWLTDQSQQDTQRLTALANDNQAVDVITVLGDGINPADPAYRGGVQFNESDDGLGHAFVSRLQYTGELFANQQFLNSNPTVIVSPGKQLQTDEVLEANILNLLARFGVPSGNVIIDLEGSDIHSTALQVNEQIDRLRLTETPYDMILVGPALKMPRARSAFAQALGGLDNKIIPAPTDYYGFQAENGDLLAKLGDIVPSAEALTLSTKVLDEYLGSLYYFARGWLYDPLDL